MSLDTGFAVSLKGSILANSGYFPRDFFICDKKRQEFCNSAQKKKKKFPPLHYFEPFRISVTELRISSCLKPGRMSQDIVEKKMRPAHLTTIKTFKENTI